MTKLKEFWSERILFGLIIILGYFGVGALQAVMPLTPEARATTRDILMTVGPLLGMIVQAIWRTDKTEKQQAESVATLVSKLPDQPPARPPEPQYEPPITSQA